MELSNGRFMERKKEMSRFKDPGFVGVFSCPKQMRPRLETHLHFLFYPNDQMLLRYTTRIAVATAALVVAVVLLCSGLVRAQINSSGHLRELYKAAQVRAVASNTQIF